MVFFFSPKIYYKKNPIKMYEQLNALTVTLLQQSSQINSNVLEKALLAPKGNISLFEYLFRHQFMTPEDAKKVLGALLKQKIPCSRCQNNLVIQTKPLQFRCEHCSQKASHIAFLPTEPAISSVPSSLHNENKTLATTLSSEILEFENLSSSQIQNILKKGQRFHIGKYEIIEEIGRGGMGIVYRVYQPDLQKHFALKLLLNNDLSSEEQIERFKNEAQIVASLDHPNIVRIQDLGQQEQYWFYTMDLIQGEPFGHWFASRLYPEVLPIYLKIVKAIAYAHEKTIIHRDIKPDNIFINTEQEPKLLDFGLAKSKGQNKNLTQSNAILGTPNYLSPEQAQGTKRVDGRSDVFSMGVILYQILTRKLPFEGNNQMATLFAILEKDPIPPRKLNPKIPKDLETICLKALEKSPQNRYHMVELQKDLERYLQGDPISTRPLSWVGRVFKKVRKYRKTTAIISGSVIGIFFLATLWFQERGKFKALQQKEKIQAQVVEAKKHASSGNFALALQALNQLIKESPQEKEALLLRGQLYQKNKNYLEASADFLSLLQQNAFLDLALFGLAECALATENRSQALEYLRRIQQKKTLPDFLNLWYKTCLESAQNLESIGLVEESETLLKEAQQQASSLVEELPQEWKNIQEKLQFYHKILRPQNKQEQLQRFVYFDQTPFLRKKLAEELNVFLQQFPEEPQARQIRASLLLDLGQYSQAINDLNWLCREFPEKPEHWEQLSHCQNKLQLFAASKENAKQAATRYIHFGNITLSRAMQRREELEKAIHAFQKTLELTPRFIEAQFSLARAFDLYSTWFENEFRLEEAIQYKEKAHDILNRHLNQFPPHILSQAQQLQNRIVAHLINLKDANEPKKARDYGVRAKLHFTAFQDHLKAIELYTEALRLEPTQVLLLNNRAGMYISLGLHDKALADLKKALETLPNFPEAVLQIYSIYKTLNNTQEEKYWKEKALELLTREGISRMQRNADLHLFNLALDLSEHAPHLIKIRAMFHLKRRATNSALNDLMLLQKKAPEDPELALLLGKVFLQMNLKPAAKSYLELFLTKNPNHEEAEALLEKTK